MLRTVAEVAAAWGVTPSCVYLWIKQGIIKLNRQGFIQNKSRPVIRSRGRPKNSWNFTSSQWRSAYRKYQAHKASTPSRGIAFELTFEQWVDVWVTSGHWHERGNRVGQYVMSRKHDDGAYAVGNVRIAPVIENLIEIRPNLNRKRQRA